MSTTASVMSSDLPMDLTEHRALIRRSQSGDLAAFDRLVALHYGDTYRIAFRMLGSQEFAEDATQEIYVKAWRSIKRYRGPASFLSWLHTITINHCLDVARKRSKELARLEPFVDDDPAGAPRDPPGAPRAFFAFARWDERIALKDALMKLPENQRVAVSLHFYAGLTIRDIAAEQGLSASTVHLRIRDALKRLARLLIDSED